VRLRPAQGGGGAAWHTGGMKARLSEGLCRAIPLVISRQVSIRDSVFAVPQHAEQLISTERRRLKIDMATPRFASPPYMEDRLMQGYFDARGEKILTALPDMAAEANAS